MTNRLRPLAVALMLGLSGAAIAHEGHDRIDAGHAWVRAMPPGAPTAAAYLRLYNNAKTPVKLVSVTTDAAKTVELHAHQHEKAVMSMRPVESIEVPAKAEAVLEPGSYHLMLMDLTKPLNEGDEVEFHLTFDNGHKIEVEAEVRSGPVTH